MLNPESEILNFNEICRGCMCRKQNMKPIFGTYLDEMFCSIVQIKLIANDGFPQQLCVQCILQVSRAFSFKQQCVHSDNKFRTQVEKTSNQAIEELKKEETTKDSDLTPTIMSFQKIHDDSEQVTPENDFNLNEEVASTLVERSDEESLSESDVNNSNHNNSIVTSLMGFNIQELDSDSIPLDLDDVNDEQEIITEYEISDNFDTSYDESGNMLLVTVKSDNLFTENVLKYFCPECGNDFNTEDELNLHKQNCNINLLNSEANVATTINVPHNDFSCDVCGKIFSESRVLRRHQKIHLSNKPHVCDICNMSFSESSNLSKHKKRHTGELRNVKGKPHLCSVCGKRFKWASSLSKHMRHHTKNNLFQCAICPKYYVESRSLDIHMRSHTGDKPYKCTFCSKNFTQKCNLEKHERVHTGVKPYECQICKKTFSQSGYISIHMRIHNKQKPYGCTECGKFFAAANTLMVHKRIHSGERPYGCTVCGKKFSRQETLVIHQRTHSGDRPYSCSICQKKFISSGHLSSHARSHKDGTQKTTFMKTPMRVNEPEQSNNSPFKCDQCYKSFTQNTALAAHMLTHDMQTVSDTLPSMNCLKNEEILVRVIDEGGNVVDHGIEIS